MKLKEKFARILSAPSLVQYFMIALLAANFSLSVCLMFWLDVVDSHACSAHDAIVHLGYNVPSANDVMDLQSDVDDIKKTLDELKGKVGNIGSFYEVESDLSDIEEKVDRLYSEVNSMSDTIDRIEDDVSTIERRVSF